MSKTLPVALNILSLLGTAIVAIYTIKSISASEVFFWHPLSMVVAYLFLMIQGVLVLCSRFSVIGKFMRAKDRNSKVDIHQFVQLMAFAFYTLGLGSILASKYINGKYHFKTWHGCIGLFALILSYIQVPVGLYLSNESIKQRVLSYYPSMPGDLIVKRLHRLVSCVSFIVVMITFLTSLSSNFIVKNMPIEISSLLWALFIMITICTFVIGMRYRVPEFLK